MTWTLAFRNLFRNSRRSLATGLAILVGFTGLVLLGGFIFRVERTLQAQTVYLKYRGHLSIYKKDGLQRFSTHPSRYQLLPDDLEKIRGVLHQHQNQIEWVGYTLKAVGLLSNGERSTPYSLLSVDIESIRRVQSHPGVRFWARDFMTDEDSLFAEAVMRDPSSISISVRLGELLGLHPPFQKLSEEQRSLQVAGLNYYGDLNAVNGELMAGHTTGSEFTEATSLMATLPLAQDLLQTDGVQTVAIFLKNREQTKKIQLALQEAVRSQELPYDIYAFDHQDISPNYVGAMGFLYVMSGFFVFLICGAVILSVLNSLTMGILERTREIGTLRALGFRRTQISWMLTQESLCLTTLACFAGALLAFLVAFAVNSLNIRYSPPGVPKSLQFLLTPDWNLFVGAYVLFMILAGVGSFGMSYLKMRTKVVELLSDAGA